MSSSFIPYSPLPSDKQLKLVADLEQTYKVKCTDYTYAGVMNFITKWYGDRTGEVLAEPDESDYEHFEVMLEMERQ